MNIFKADYEDLPAILELQRLCYQENALRYDDFNIPPLMETIDDMHAEFRRYLFLKYVLEDQIIGSVRAYEKEGTCFIEKLIVHPEYQNHGIGKQLMKEIESKYKLVFRFELFTGYKDEKNLSFYKKLGYSEFKSERIKENLYLVYMEKER